MSQAVRNPSFGLICAAILGTVTLVLALAQPNTADPFALFAGSQAQFETDIMMLQTISPLEFALGILAYSGGCFAMTTWLTRSSQPGYTRFGPNPHEVPQ